MCSCCVGGVEKSLKGFSLIIMSVQASSECLAIEKYEAGEKKGQQCDACLNLTLAKQCKACCSMSTGNVRTEGTCPLTSSSNLAHAVKDTLPVMLALCQFY